MIKSTSLGRQFNISQLFCCAMLFGLLFGWGAPCHALKITSVSVDQSTVENQHAYVARLVLEDMAADETVDVDFNIYDERQYQIKKITQRALGAGQQVMDWDLTDIRGKRVPDGLYFYTLHAKGKNTDVIYDVSDITGKEILSPVTVHWNKESRQITYTLPKPALVGIRVGLDDRGPLLNTLVNWQVRPAGTHTEVWDGMDASSVLDLSEHPHLLLVAEAFSLPDNNLFVLTNLEQFKKQGSQFTENVLVGDQGQQIKRTPQSTPVKKMHEHAQQSVEGRHDYPILLSIAHPNKKKRKDGAIPVKGEVNLVLDVDPALYDHLIGQRFEQSFYIDGRYHFENEIGYLPATFKWDSSAYSEGIHYITANLRGYEGNFGMATVKLYVEK